MKMQHDFFCFCEKHDPTMFFGENSAIFNFYHDSIHVYGNKTWCVMFFCSKCKDFQVCSIDTFQFCAWLFLISTIVSSKDTSCFYCMINRFLIFPWCAMLDHYCTIRYFLRNSMMCHVISKDDHEKHLKPVHRVKNMTRLSRKKVSKLQFITRKIENSIEQTWKSLYCPFRLKLPIMDWMTCLVLTTTLWIEH